MKIKNSVLLSKNFNDAIKKIYKCDLQLKERIKVSEFCKFYDQNIPNIVKILSDYSKKNDSNNEIQEFLNEEIEVPCIPKSILTNETILLSSQDILSLELIAK